MSLGWIGKTLFQEYSKVKLTFNNIGVKYLLIISGLNN